MSYIITAEVSTEDEVNCGADIGAVDARILCNDGVYITFDIRGDFYKTKELTKYLCSTLINAGFVAFKIGHSY